MARREGYQRRIIKNLATQVCNHHKSGTVSGLSFFQKQICHTPDSPCIESSNQEIC
ncbi:MAG: hypothetical protein K2O42_08530 [Oscillospiraceae bacterium]|nr:hypothetical protein [Oscillospiraceae bacterium]